VPMRGKTLPDALAREDLKRGEESRPIAFVVMHPCLRPFTHMGNDGCVRSEAWIDDFSTMHSSIAFSGGFR